MKRSFYHNVNNNTEGFVTMIKCMRTVTMIFLFFILAACNADHTTGNNRQMDTSNNKIEKSDQQWKEELSSEQYAVIRQCGTEAPGSGKYYSFYKSGKYLCAACGQELFSSETKYSSGSGWPSFYDVISSNKVKLLQDTKYGMMRTEVKCSRCDGHLGHVFNDGPKPTYLRYCINSVALRFEPSKE